MMRSLFSGVSGLKTHQTKMDVIGNNISNVNTTAYKSASITFNELMSQTTQSASGPNVSTGTGGTNARQIGLGVKSGAINTNIAGQGASQSTGNPFDVMITGSAFFVVNNGQENFFTRDGSFYVDGAGNLAMTSTGYNVMGWGVDETTGNIKKDTVSALRIMSAANMTYPPEATSQAYLAGIMDKNDKDVTSANGKTVSLNFFDALGYSYTAKFTFRRSDVEKNNEYSMELAKVVDSTGKEVDISALTFGQASTQASTQKVSFDKTAFKWDGNRLQSVDGNTTYADASLLLDGSGNLQSRDFEVQLNGQTTTVGAMLDNIAKAYGHEGSTDEFLKLYTDDGTNKVSVEQMLINLANGSTTNAFPTFDGTEADTSFEVQGRYFNGFTVSYDPNKGTFAGINGIATQETITLGLSALGGNFSNITVDISETSMCDNKGTSTLGADTGTPDNASLGAGRRLGDMTNIAIQSNGMIYASYDNGMTKLLGQIATAEFANASGLEKAGDNLYSATLNSGSFDGVGSDVTANGGYMSTGQLEMSNVDLSSEFTEMITTQRGFQANSRIITVSDTLLEELTNLKR